MIERYQVQDVWEISGNKYNITTFTDCSNQLPLETRVKIATELTPLTGIGFLRSDLHSQELSDDVFNHVVTSPRLVIARNEDNFPVAFIAGATFRALELDFYHLGGIIVTPNLQGSGLGRKMLIHELQETNVQAIVLRTQSKKMLGLAKKVAHLDDQLTLMIAPVVYPKNLDGTINRGVYREGQSLYENTLEFKEDAIDWINWQNGDSLVVAGYIPV